MQYFVQQLVNGLTLGSIYGLIAIGYTMVYGIIGIMAILGPGITNVIIAVSIVYIPAFARIVRGSVLSIRALQYIEAAEAIGSTPARIIVKKVTVNDPGATSFTADINNTDGSEGDVNNVAFSQATPGMDSTKLKASSARLIKLPPPRAFIA